MTENLIVERLRPECISCVIKQQLEKCPEDAPEDIRRDYMQRVLKVLAEAPKTASAPVVVREINRIQMEMFGFTQDFREKKRHYNQVMLEKEADIWERLEQSTDALKFAIQYAMTGNYIDFGTVNNVDEGQLAQMLDAAGENPIDAQEYAALQQDLSKAEKVLFITDNCGEIVLDKLLIRQIKKKYPQVDITVMVRGGEVLNDATRMDAECVGLAELVNVIDNGNDIAGTCLEALSEEAFNALNNADVILAKGQANFETLRKCGRNIYYIFMCKCDLFARGFQVERFTGILVNDKNCV